jgi:protein ImuB
MNWLAIHLTDLPLMIFERAQQTPLPLAVSEGGRLVACNAAARGQGIRAGMADAAARVLAADLRILPRRPAAERAALERLAAWALRFSDQVSLDLAPARPRALVLEAGRSLCLFGGGEALRRQVADGVAGLGWRARCVLAPTPAGALLLAAAGHDGIIADLDALRRALAPLPPALLGLEQRALDDLAAMGVRGIGDLLRLPRAGLAERIGLDRVQQIERLLGERPDPRRAFAPPARFSAELELPAEVPDAGALVFAARRLIDELGGFLLARQGGVQRLRWRLAHADQPPTRFDLGSARPERDPERWLALLRERLQRLTLPAPVRALGLRSEALRPLPPVTGELLAERAAVAPDLDLLDRLAARLGAEAVRGLRLCADHRPERAWRWGDPGEPPAPGLPRPDRPLWLLPEPLALPERDRRPWLDGPLDLGQGCERIETGWWDGGEVARDYYVAAAPSGERFWIYREMRGARRWFVQGIFGGSSKVEV